MAPLKLPDPPDQVTVTVDGREFPLPKGKNLLQALLDEGHYVPHYCYHPKLAVDGNCRLCLVEIEGRPRPEISCNMVATDGLKIKTESEMVDDCRKGMMEFLLVNHPLDCPVCDRGGECMLQRYSMDYGWGTARVADERRRFQKPQLDPLIDIERNRCIMCTRCVRFCDQVGGDHVMGVFGHGNRNYIGTYGNGPVSNPFSGNVIDICPVGCLTSKPFRFEARVWELRQTFTTTRHCNGPVTAWTRDGVLYRTTPPARFRKGYYTIDEDTQIFISNEARFGSYYANSPERLTQARVGKGAAQTACDWNLALSRAATALRDVPAEQVGILAGERSTNEEFYLLNRLARAVLKTPHIDWRSRFISAEAAEAAGLALRASDGDLELLEKGAYGAMIMINAADLLGSAPDIALKLKEGARRLQTKLAIVDSRIESWFGDHAKALYLEQPGELAAVVGNLAEGLAKGREAENAPEGYATVFNQMAGAAQGLIVLGLDAAGGALNPALVPAALKLVAALGEGWHFLPVTAARNAKGAFACGGQSDRLPTGELDQQGASAPEILRRAAAGEFKTLLLNRVDELVHHPNRALIEQALEATETVIAIDIFPSWITERASVVLPGSLFYEVDGSMTDIDGTLQRMSQGVRPPGAAQEEWRIIESLCTMLGDPVRYRTAQDVFNDLVKCWGAPKPIRLDDLLLAGPGGLTPQVHSSSAYFNKRGRPNLKLNFSERPSAEAAAASPAKAGGLQLMWTMHSQGPDHLGSRSEEFAALRPRPMLELSAADAQAAGLAEGDWVVLQGLAAEPSQIKFNPHIAAGIAYGAANVLGLTFAADFAGLPAITLIKTEAPAELPPLAPEQIEVHT